MAQRIILTLTVATMLCGLVVEAQANLILGIGSASLDAAAGGSQAGMDLTDIGNNGVEGSYAPPALGGFDAEFFSSDEPGFGGGEFAFNVFDNVLSGGNGKWCCGTSFPQIVGAHKFTSIAGPIQLTSFTVSSANDVPGRDPRVWRIEGSNDTTTGLDGTWTTIYDHPVAVSDWASRLQVNRYSPADGDTFLTTQGFTAFRMVTTATGGTSGAFFQLGEIELFGVEAPSAAIPEPSTFGMAIVALGCCGWIWRRRKR